MTIKPLHDYVVVEAKQKQVSKVIHVAGDSKGDTGTVIAVGPGELLPSGERGEMSLKAGDEIIFANDVIREDKQDDGSIQYWMRIVNVMGILRES